MGLFKKNKSWLEQDLEDLMDDIFKEAKVEIKLTKLGFRRVVDNYNLDKLIYGLSMKELNKFFGYSNTNRCIYHYNNFYIILSKTKWLNKPRAYCLSEKYDSLTDISFIIKDDIEEIKHIN